MAAPYKLADTREKVRFKLSISNVATAPPLFIDNDIENIKFIPYEDRASVVATLLLRLFSLSGRHDVHSLIVHDLAPLCRLFLH